MKTNGKTGLTRIIFALKYSYEGFISVIQNEAAFRQELFLTFILIPLVFYINVSIEMKAILIAANILVLIVEILNSAIEAIVDKASPEKHPLAKVAKDAGSLAVLFSIINLIVMWSLAMFS